MKSTALLIAVLKVSFDERKNDNRRYSLRAFARDLGTSASVLSRVLSGKRSPTMQTVTRWLDILEIPKPQRNEILGNLSRSRRQSHLGETASIPGAVADWLAPAIIEWMRCETVKNLNTKTVVKRFHVTSARAESVLRSLIEAKVLIQNRGRWLVNNSNHLTFLHQPGEFSKIMGSIVRRINWQEKVGISPPFLKRYMALAIEKSQINAFTKKFDHSMRALLLEFQSVNPDQVATIVIGGAIVDEKCGQIEPDLL